MTKEQIYDEQISPLIRQIIAICNEHKIANVCVFSLDSQSGLNALTCNTTDEVEAPEHFRECVKILRPQRNTLMVTVDHGDGNKTINAIL